MYHDDDINLRVLVAADSTLKSFIPSSDDADCSLNRFRRVCKPLRLLRLRQMKSDV